jgi:YD repeat-containing protein
LEQKRTGINYSKNSKKKMEMSGTCDKKKDQQNGMQLNWNTYRNIITRTRIAGQRTIQKRVLRESKEMEEP